LALLEVTLIDGISVGSLYGLLGLGLVLIYRATGVANFAHGEMSMISTFIAHILLTSAGLPLALAVFGAIVFAALMGICMERIVIRPLEGAAPWSIVFATFGVNLALNGTGVALWARNQPYLFPPVFPRVPIHIGNARFSSLHLGIIGLVAVLVVLFMVFFRCTKLGLAMRATAQDKKASELMGISVKRIRILAWIMGSAFGAVAGILFAPVVFLETTMMIPFLMKGVFAAFVGGGMVNITGALLGGVFVGIIESFVGSYLFTEGRDATALIILIIVLLIKPQGLLGATRIKKV